MSDNIRDYRRRIITDDQATRLRRWKDLYGPVLLGFGFLAVGLANMLKWDFNPNYFLILAALTLTIISLQRAHEAEHGFSDWTTGSFTSTLYSAGILLLIVGYAHSMTLITLIGGSIIVGTAYINNRD